MSAICLSMIVKNESKIIERLLRSVLPIIDTYCICDTGSTDNTVELITAFMEKAGKPGCVIQEPFRNFGYNRTFALERAKDWGKYALLLDADMILEVNETFKKEDITADGYTLMQHKHSGGLEYKNLRLIRTDIGVKCVGPTHEIYGNYPPGTSIQHLTSLRINDQNDGGCKTTKYERDIQLLKEALITEPENSRYMFYLANSYRDCGQGEQAVECYIKNLALQGWLEEKYISCLSIYEHLKLMGREREGLSYLVEAHKYSPTRIEHIYRLVTYYSNQKMYSVALAYYNLITDHYLQNYNKRNAYDETLFRNISEYTFYFPYMMIIVGGNSANHDIVYKMYRIIFHHKNTNIGDWFIGNLFFNLRCLSTFTPDMTVLQDMLTYCKLLRERGFVFTDNINTIIANNIDGYKSALVAPVVFTHHNKEHPRVMFTVTTCKRFDLFQQTMNSVLRTWTDISAVDYFFCVDDNSSTSDREQMKTQYPFFEFYMKSSEERGHRESMNIIWQRLKELQPTYWIHMEDDWLFFHCDNYVTKSIAFLDKYKDQSIHQILFNRNYAELYTDWTVQGGVSLEKDYIVHNKSDVIKGRNAGYWPHYSFRPSMILTETVLKLGDYTTPNTFFERDYADKWFAAGYRSGFFDTIVSKHIGKLTSDKLGPNAYALNNMSQF